MTVEWMKPRIKSIMWNIRKQKTNHTEQEEKRIQKNEGSRSSLWDNCKRSNICIIGVPEGEGKEQEIGNLFEKTMKKILPNLVKEIDMQVQEAENPKQDGSKEAHFKKHHNKMPKVKDKERILKTAREKKFVTRWLPDERGVRENGCRGEGIK